MNCHEILQSRVSSLILPAIICILPLNPKIVLAGSATEIDRPPESLMLAGFNPNRAAIGATIAFNCTDGHITSGSEPLHKEVILLKYYPTDSFGTLQPFTFDEVETKEDLHLELRQEGYVILPEPRVVELLCFGGFLFLIIRFVQREAFFA